ncbi:KGG domain-containing protein [Candidatus Paracaedibacter symbiosus]|uniref:KGG domain-containing protein n=1 Tax=Candidatus Paracaedibacter symbiosus TaxID=244582 RepID=UPI000509A5BE|nr:KGG domain-containing protein [Candidatus Paracaedibacter symbiosus]
MTNSRNDRSQDNSKKSPASKGKQGFASMPKEEVREIAAKGGRHSHDNDRSKDHKTSKDK